MEIKTEIETRSDHTTPHTHYIYNIHILVYSNIRKGWRETSRKDLQWILSDNIL